MKMFHRQDGQRIPAPGIVLIGHVDSRVGALGCPGPTRVTIPALEEGRN